MEICLSRKPIAPMKLQKTPSLWVLTICLNLNCVKAIGAQGDLGCLCEDRVRESVYFSKLEWASLQSNWTALELLSLASFMPSDASEAFCSGAHRLLCPLSFSSLYSRCPMA